MVPRCAPRAQPGPDVPGLVAVVVALAAAAIGFVGALARQRDVPRYRTVWAEDGAVFGECALTDPFPPACLVMPYDGYLHVVPRTLAWIAASLPPEWFSYSITAVAALALAACAFLVARAIAEGTSSPIAGLIAGVSLSLVYPAGAEVIGNVTNLPWVLFVASAAVLTCMLLGRPLGRLDAALVLLTILSSPFGLVVVGVLALGLLLSSDRGRGRSRLLITATVLALVQLAMAFLSPRDPVPHPPITGLTPIEWFIELVFVTGPFGGRGLVPGWMVGILAAAILAVLAWRGYRPAGAASSRSSDRLGPWRPLLAMLTLGAAAATVFAGATYLNRHVTARYDYVPAVAVVIAAVLGTALAARSWSRSEPAGGRRIDGSVVAVLVVATVLAVGFGSTFRVMTRASPGPSYPAVFREGARACEAGAEYAVIPISPLPAGSVTTTWEMRIPCARIAS